jgi:pimeloyl-ACP methyl ester carboxylesterase
MTSIKSLNSTSKSIVLRDWYWRGWQIRYGFVRSVDSKLPILLIHGFGAAIAHWRKNQIELAQHHSVYAIDLLGFGGSAKAATLFNPELWVEQIYQFWQAIIREPIIIVGNSIGSTVAIMAAAKYPQMVKGVVGISIPDLSELEAMVPPSVRPIKRSMEAIIGGLVAIPAFNLIKQPAVIRWVLKNLVYGDRSSEAVDNQLVELIAEPARDKRSATTFSYLNRGLNNSAPNLKVAIANLEVPLLILWGTKDRLIPPSFAKKLVVCSPLARLVYLEGIGHCPQDEAPERINQEILLWIDSFSVSDSGLSNLIEEDSVLADL